MYSYRSVLLLMAIIQLASSSPKAPYETTVDDLFKSFLGEDVYKHRRLEGAGTHDFSEYFKNFVPESNSTEEIVNVTTARYNHVATVAPPTPKLSFNFSMEDVKTRMRAFEMEDMLEYHTAPIDFAADDVEVISRRFDEIRNTPRESRRNVEYHEKEDAHSWYVEKNKTISIIQQFVYMTRYNLVYSQLLRTKYMNDVKYKLGYCFAQLRVLKLQQMRLIHTFRTELLQRIGVYFKSNYSFARYDYGGLNLKVFLKFYEKIVRFDVDIKDIIKLVKQLELRRKQIEFEDFYSHFSSSTGRVWRRDAGQ